MKVSALPGSNLPIIKRQNRSLVLRILLHHGPVSRSEIVDMTRLTATTVGNAIGELLDSDLVMELGVEQPALPRRLGRRRSLVDLNPGGLYVVGVHLGVRTIRVGVGDLRGRVLHKVMVLPGGPISPEEAFAVVAEQVQEVLRAGGVPPGRICAVGVGSVGLVNSATGEIVEMPQYGWKAVPAGRRLGEMLRLPVVVDGSHRAMATAEAWLGLGRGLDSVMLVHAGTTVGGAVVFRGEALPGARHCAGQLGHLIVEEQGKPCACGQRGCLDTVASGSAIVSRSVDAVSRGRSPILGRFVGLGPASLRLERVFAAVRQGDPEVRAIVERAAEYLGIALAHYVSLFDPQIVVLAGPLVRQGGTEYQRRVVEVARRRSCHLGDGEVKIVPSSFGDDTELVGPMALALRRFVYWDGLALTNEKQPAVPGA